MQLKSRIGVASIVLALHTSQALAGYYLITPLKASPGSIVVPETPEQPAAANLAALPIALTFAPVQLGDAAAPQRVSLSNPGTIPLSLENIRWSAVGPFSAMVPCPTLDAGASCDSYVYLDSNMAVGTYDQTLLIDHQGSAGTLHIPVKATIAAQMASLTSSLDFGTVPVGSAKDAQLKLTNTGIGRLSLTLPTSSALSGDGYSYVGTDCGSALPVGGSCAFNLRLTGTKAGTQAGSFTISTGAGPVTAALHGIGQQSDVMFSSGPVPNFGRINVGTSSESGLVTLKNIGNLPATDIALSATNDKFAVVSSNCGTDLQAGAACTLKVKFSPEVPGVQSGELQVRAAGNLVAVSPLSGIGASAPLLLTPNTYGFNVVVGSPQTMNMTVTNTGSASVELLGMDASVSLAGLSIAPTTGTGSCGTNLAGGATCKYYFKLDATAITNTGIITFSLDSSNGRFTDSAVTMAGSWATLTANPSSAVAFGSVGLGDAPVSAVIDVKNNASNVASTTLTYGLPPGFSLVNNNCGSVSVRQTTCQLQIQFAPEQDKDYSGSVTLTTKTGNGTPYTLSIPVSGKGVAPATLGWSGGDLAAVELGTSKQAKVSLYNPGNSAITLEGLTLTGNASEFSIVGQTCAASLAAKSMCAVTVAFNPTAVGTRPAATLAIVAGGANITKQLSGVGGKANFTSSLARLSFKTMFVTQTGVQDAFQDIQVGITNTGTTAAEDLKTEIRYDGVPQSFSLQYNACSARLNAGTTCTTRVRGIGGTVGTHTGVVRVSSASSSLEIPFSMTLVKPDLDFTATVPVKDTAVGSASIGTYTVQGKSMGRFTVTLPQISGNTDEYSIASGTTCTNISVPTSGSCIVKVLFTPTVKGPRPAATLTSTVGGEQRTIVIQASGL